MEDCIDAVDDSLILDAGRVDAALIEDGVLNELAASLDGAPAYLLSSLYKCCGRLCDVGQHQNADDDEQVPLILLPFTPY